MMVPMRNRLDERKRVRIGAVAYAADPGEVIEVHRLHVGYLAPRGFDRVDELEDDAGTDRPLEDLSLGELTERARTAEIPGRSTMNRGDLIAALRDHDEE